MKLPCHCTGISGTIFVSQPMLGHTFTGVHLPKSHVSSCNLPVPHATTNNPKRLNDSSSYPSVTSDRLLTVPHCMIGYLVPAPLRECDTVHAQIKFQQQKWMHI